MLKCTLHSKKVVEIKHIGANLEVLQWIRSHDLETSNAFDLLFLFTYCKKCLHHMSFLEMKGESPEPHANTFIIFDWKRPITETLGFIIGNHKSDKSYWLDVLSEPLSSLTRKPQRKHGVVDIDSITQLWIFIGHHISSTRIFEKTEVLVNLATCMERYIGITLFFNDDPSYYTLKATYKAINTINLSTSRSVNKNMAKCFYKKYEIISCKERRRYFNQQLRLEMIEVLKETLMKLESTSQSTITKGACKSIMGRIYFYWEEENQKAISSFQEAISILTPLTTEVNNDDYIDDDTQSLLKETKLCILDNIHELFLIYRKENRHEEAKRCLQNAVKINQHEFLDRQLIFYECLGDIEYENEEEVLSTHHYEQTLKLDEQASVGAVNNRQLRIHSKLARNYQALGMYEKAISALENAVELCENATKYMVTEFLYTIAELYTRMDDIRSAWVYYQVTYELGQSSGYYSNKLLSVKSLYQMGCLLQKEGCNGRALVYFEKGLKSAKRNLGEIDPTTAQLYQAVAEEQKNKRAWANAMILMEKAYEINKITHGPMHPITIQSKNAFQRLLIQQGNKKVVN